MLSAPPRTDTLAAPALVQPSNQAVGSSVKWWAVLADTQKEARRTPSAMSSGSDHRPVDRSGPLSSRDTRSADLGLDLKSQSQASQARSEVHRTNSLDLCNQSQNIPHTASSIYKAITAKLTNFLGILSHTLHYARCFSKQQAHNCKHQIQKTKLQLKELFRYPFQRRLAYLACSALLSL